MFKHEPRRIVGARARDAIFESELAVAPAAQRVEQVQRLRVVRHNYDAVARPPRRRRRRRRRRRGRPAAAGGNERVRDDGLGPEHFPGSFFFAQGIGLGRASCVCVLWQFTLAACGRGRPSSR